MSSLGLLSVKRHIPAFSRVCMFAVVAMVLLNGCDNPKQPPGSKKGEDHTEVEEILALKPVSYWPLADREGDVLVDISEDPKSPGLAINISRRNGLLDFDSGFQWLLLPSPPEMKSAKAFSTSGWYFTRRGDYIGGSNLLGPKRHESDDYHKQGVSLLSNAYAVNGGRGGPDGTWVMWKNYHLKDGFGLRLRAHGQDRSSGSNLLGAIHGTHADAVGSAAGGVQLGTGKWHHVAYTYDHGKAVLYLNGDVVAEADNVPLQPSDRPFLVGNEIGWWMLYPEGSQSWHGSIRDIALFDRVLSPTDIQSLAHSTQPAVTPEPLEDRTVLLDGRMFRADRLEEVCTDDLPPVLASMADWPHARLKPMEADLLSVLMDAAQDWRVTPSVVRILVSLDTEKSRDALDSVLKPRWTRVVADSSASETQRAGAALGLAAMGASAQAALPTLIEGLREIESNDGARALRVEDLLRNALLRALIDIAPRDEQVRSLVSKSLIEPLHAIAPPDKVSGHWFTQGDAYRDSRQNHNQNDRAYSPVVIDKDGTRYQVGSGVPWHSGKKLSREDLEEAVSLLPETHHEEARNWMYFDSEKVFGIEIHKTTPGGQSATSLLEGPWFAFSGHDVSGGPGDPKLGNVSLQYPGEIVATAWRQGNRRDRGCPQSFHEASLSSL